MIDLAFRYPPLFLAYLVVLVALYEFVRWLWGVRVERRDAAHRRQVAQAASRTALEERAAQRLIVPAEADELADAGPNLEAWRTLTDPATS